ncbi:MAG TPA: hypothetical protein DDW98_03820, partial [Gammaproteobacteria bacterium]|nr:hypothetical protein [Gammaproteobacteria bacterium]
MVPVILAGGSGTRLWPLSREAWPKQFLKIGSNEHTLLQSTVLRARAIENEVFVVGCNRTGQEPSLKNGEPMAFPGDGRIVDPTGEVLAAGSGDAGAILATIELRKTR